MLNMRGYFFLLFILYYAALYGKAQDTALILKHYKAIGVNFTATQAYFSEFSYYFNKNFSTQLIAGYEQHKRIDKVALYDQISSNGYYIGAGITKHFNPLIKSKKTIKKVIANPTFIAKIGYGKMKFTGKNIFKGNFYNHRTFTSPTEIYPFAFLSIAFGYEISFFNRIKLSYSPIIINGNIFQERLPKVPEYSLVLGKKSLLNTAIGIHYLWK
jgi:hypothetical protein